MDTAGTHLLVEYGDCDPVLLDDPDGLEVLLRRAADATGSVVVQTAFHRFESRGVTGILLLETSHLSIHTWPERNYAAVDLYTCGAGDPVLAASVIRQGLQAGRAELLTVHRGEPSNGPLLRLGQHELD